MMPAFTYAAPLVQDYERHEGIISFRPYALANVTYDSNIFKLSNVEQAKSLLGTSQVSDVIQKKEIGLETKVRLSRQLITVDLNLNDAQYEKFNNLNYSGSRENVRWDWVVGDHFDGVLSYNDKEIASGFADVVSSNETVKSNNIIDYQKTAARLNWHFKPDWAVHASYSQEQYENKAAVFSYNDKELDTLECGISYESSKQITTAISYKNTVTDYAHRSPQSIALFGSTNTQDRINITVGWNISPQLTLKSDVFFISLNYPPEHSVRNTDNLGYQLEAFYTPTEDAKVSVILSKDVIPIEDVFFSNSEQKRVMVSPSWKVTEKISVGGDFEYKTIDYLGNSDPASSASRSDEVTRFSAYSRYYPIQKLAIEAAYTNISRDSNTPGRNFNDETISATVVYEF
ncbi:MAG TPA: hypothetical protein VGJ90_13775 [Methylophilaceae bacterium]|jgi:hypothetical protein